MAQIGTCWKQTSWAVPAWAAHTWAGTTATVVTPGSGGGRRIKWKELFPGEREPKPLAYEPLSARDTHTLWPAPRVETVALAQPADEGLPPAVVIAWLSMLEDDD